MTASLQWRPVQFTWVSKNWTLTSHPAVSCLFSNSLRFTWLWCFLNHKKNKKSGVPTCSTVFRTSLQSECTTKCYNQPAFFGTQNKGWSWSWPHDDDHFLRLEMIGRFRKDTSWTAPFFGDSQCCSNPMQWIIAPRKKVALPTTIIPFCEDNH